jgi:hypothetical protein
LALPKQTTVLASQLMLWSTHKEEEEALLCKMMQSYFCQSSSKRLGLDDYTWVVVRASMVSILVPQHLELCVGDKERSNSTPHSMH